MFGRSRPARGRTFLVLVAAFPVAIVVASLLGPVATLAAGAFRSASSASVTSGNLVINKPTGTANNDVMIAAVATRPLTAAITPPSGWTLVQRIDNANTSGSSLAIYYHVATSEGSSYTWTMGLNAGTAACMMSFSGMSTSAPIDASAGQNTPSGYQHAAPSIMPTVSHAMILSFHEYASSNPWTPPSGMTEDVDVGTEAAPSVAGISLECNHLLQTSATPTGALTATTVNDVNIDVGNAFALALRPANDAPVLDTTKTPSLGTLAEDPGVPSGAVGSLVSSLVDFASPAGQVDNVTDSDSGAVLGVAITASSASLTCSYSLNGGTTWTAVGAVSDTSARLLAADADDRLYCQPNANVTGSFASAVTVRAWDQSSGTDGSTADTSTNGGSTAFSSATDGVSITITALNDAPTATNLSAAETYLEDTALDLVDIVASDVDSTTVTATLTLSNPAAGSLSTATSGPVTSTFSAGVWSASGPIASVNALLAGVTFSPAADYSGNFAIVTSISDGIAAPVTGSKAMIGTPLNDAPTATNLSAAETYLEDTALDLVDIVASDVDSTTVTATLTLSNPAAGSLSTATSGPVTSTFSAGVWSASGPIASVNALLAGVTFSPAADYSGNFAIVTSISDGIAAPVTGSKAMIGTPLNDAPTATNLSAAETYLEDTALDLVDIVASDVDSTTVTATLTLSNPAAGSLSTATSGPVTSTFSAGVWSASGPIASVNALLAGVTFSPAADYSGNFAIVTSISDGIAAPVTGSKAMIGTPANDAPVLDTTKTPSLGTLAEDPGVPSGAVGSLVSSLVDFASPAGQVDNVTDSDSGAVLGVAITASSASLTCSYSLNGGTTWTAVGAVSDTSARLLAADADDRLYCQPNANVTGSFASAVTVRAWDQSSGTDGSTADTSTNGGSTAFSSATDGVSITITALNDAPTATNLSAAETYLEDTALDLVDIVASDVDSTTVTATLTLSNPAAGSLSTATSGPVTSTFSAGVWSASGPIASVNALLAGVTFSPAADYSGNFAIVTSISDGIAAPVTGSKAMIGTPLNDAPTATNLSAAETYLEDTALDLVDIVASDVDSTTVTATLTLSNPAAGSLSTATSGPVTSTFSAGVWSASGPIASVNALLAGVTFSPAADYSGNFAIVTSISDGIAAPVTGSKAMIGTPLNDAPTATNLSAAETYLEDTALDLVDIVASDVDSTTVTATLTLSNPAAGSLSTATSGPVTSTFSAGVWSASGPIASVNALLAGVTFSPAADYSGNFAIVTSISDGIAAPVTGSKAMIGTPATLTRIAVTPANPSIAVGTDQQFSATGTYSDASTADLTGAVTWSSATSVTATIDGTGLAHGVAPGTSTIGATLGSVSGSTVLTVTAPVTKANQTITFASIPNKTLAQSPLTVNPTASSGLTVTLSSTTPAVCTVSGFTITLVTAGTCTIQAAQPGDTVYNPAPTVTRNFKVTKANQTITFASIPNKTLAQSPLTVNPTASSGLTVTLSSTTPAVCTVSGFTITLVTAGTCTIQAAQPGDTVYNPAPTVTRNFKVTKANQTITFASIPNKTLAQSPLTVNPTASSGLTVTLSSTTPAVCTVSGFTITLVTAGTCTIQAAQPGDTVYNPAPTVTRNFKVTKANQTITFASIPNKTLAQSPLTVNPTASSGLTVTLSSTTPAVCTVSGFTITLVTAGTCTIQAAQPGDTVYNPAPTVTRNFKVQP